MRHYALGVGEHECWGEVCDVPTSKFTPRYFATSQVWEFSFQIVGEGYAVTYIGQDKGEKVRLNVILEEKGKRKQDTFCV